MWRKARRTKTEAEVKKTYKSDVREELSIDYNGFNYIVIIGKHINGWFIAIPNWNVCTEAGNPIDSYYNREKLANVLNDVNVGVAIADCITEWWRSKYEVKECE